MSLDVLMCLPPTLECFVKEMRSKENVVSLNIVSLDDFFNSPTPISVVVGKVALIYEYEPNKKITFVAKEVLPDMSYGCHFFVIIEMFLLEPVQNIDLQRGDRFAFCNPTCTKTEEMNNKLGKVKIRYIVRHGQQRSDRMWCARKDPTNKPLSLGLATKPTDTPTGGPSPPRATTMENNCVSTISTTEKEKNSSALPCKKMKMSEPKIPSTKTDGVKNLAAKLKETTLEDKNQNQPSSNKGRESAIRPINVVNPRYNYQRLADVKSSAMDKPSIKVNTICVVLRVLKPLCKTPAGKFTVIVETVDESMENGETLKIHFFTIEDTILKEISQGDVLQLHRLQMEIFGGDTDGRIFNSTDITLFKPNSSGYISVAKKTVITESEKMKAEELKTWFQEKYINLLLSDAVSLSEIADSGSYKLFCKVIEEPRQAEQCLKLGVSDGTVIWNLSPALPLVEGSPSLVTEISIWTYNTALNTIKMNDYVLFNSVDVEETDCLTLSISLENRNKFVVINKDNIRALEMERLIEENSTLPDEQLELIDVMERDDVDQLEFNNVMESDNLEPLELNNVIESEDLIPEITNSPTNLNENQLVSSNEEQILCNDIIVLEESSQNENSPENETNNEEEVEGSNKTKTELNSSQGKQRKTLFTANIGDWSDATEDLSDNTPPKSDDSAEVLVPADKSISGIFELLKDNYCSPKKLPSGQESPAKNSTSGKKAALPSKKDNALDKSLEQNNTLLPSLNEHIGSNAEKSLLNPVSTDDQDDVSTVINVFSHLSGVGTRNRTRKIVLKDEENMSTEQLTPTVKVSSWLQQNESDMGNEEDEELDLDMLKSLLITEDDLSSLIEIPIISIGVFFESVLPNPEKTPFNLVSGFCKDGCQQVYLFSTIDWEFRGAEIWPFCPACNKLDKSMTLTLVFMFELVVFDIEGSFCRIVVCREHAEFFLNCSVRNYLKDQSQRERCIRMLTFLTKSKESKGIRPKIDVSLTFVKNVACLVETRLKLPGPI